MKKIIHNISTGQVMEVDMTEAEITARESEIAQYAAWKAIKEAEPKPGQDLLDAIDEATTVAAVRAVLRTLVERIYTLEGK
jgi:hypothetical protein